MTPADETPAAALARSTQNPAAFRAVFDAHHGEIRGYLRHRVGDLSLAEDLAAETFARAFAARRSFRDTGAGARPWLFTIATNLLRDEARARAQTSTLRRLLRPPDPVLLELPDDPDPQLRAALATLRRDELDTLLLHAWGELTYEEIATVTGTRVGTVRSRLSRARARMRAALTDAETPPRPEHPRPERNPT